MISNEQIEFIENLYEEMGQDVEVDLDSLSKIDASNLIKELIDIKREME